MWYRELWDLLRLITNEGPQITTILTSTIPEPVDFNHVWSMDQVEELQGAQEKPWTRLLIEASRFLQLLASAKPDRVNCNTWAC